MVLLIIFSIFLGWWGERRAQPSLHPHVNLVSRPAHVSLGISAGQLPSFLHYDSAAARVWQLQRLRCELAEREQAIDTPLSFFPLSLS